MKLQGMCCAPKHKLRRTNFCTPQISSFEALLTNHFSEMLTVYLSSLTYRSNWKTNESNIEINDLVLLKKDKSYCNTSRSIYNFSSSYYVNIEGNHQSLKFIIWKMMWSRLLKVGGYPVKLIFISYLISQRRNMGHWQGYSCNHMMLITVLYLFNIKFSKSPVTRLDCKIWLLASAGFESGTLDPELTCCFIVPLSTKPVKLDN